MATTSRFLLWMALVASVNLGVTGVCQGAPVVCNPGFEEGTPGSNFFNDIPFWDESDLLVSDPGGPGPEGFTDGTSGKHNVYLGSPAVPRPEGTNAAFIKGFSSYSPGTLCGWIGQTVSGFEPGHVYQVTLFHDERGAVSTSVAGLVVKMGDATIVDSEVIRTPSFFRRAVSRPFTATSADQVLRIESVTRNGDTALLLDKISIREIGLLAWQDTFDLANGTSTPATPRAAMDINTDLAARQAAMLAPASYVETAHSASGSLNAYTQIDHALAPDALLLGSADSTRTHISPNQDFDLGGARLQKMVLECDVDPYVTGSPGTDSDNWIAIRLGDSARLQDVKAPGDGFGILFRNDGRFATYDGSTLITSEPANSAFASTAAGFHTVRIEVELEAFDGASPAVINVFVDDALAPLTTYVKNAGFSDNYITLTGNSSGSSVVYHGVDNLNVWFVVPEPRTWTLLAAGLAGLFLGRRRRRSAVTGEPA